ncbi:MAG: DUF1003 domain-containing protein [Acidobacteriia bacterium]|nr:DUF1003 domain-containing protein [Terriglobia bacterium]
MARPLISTETAATAKSSRRNIEAVAKLEESYIQNRSFADRVADAIGSFSGSLRFVFLHILVYGLWIVLNLRLVPFIPAFDPHPFLLLGLVVSIEAIFLSTFVLMKQNRMARRADQRAQLDLQINLLAEREMTLALTMLQRISTRLGVRVAGEEVQELTEETSLETLASEIKEKLSDE